MTLTCNFKVTVDLLKVRFWPFFHILAQSSYTESLGLPVTKDCWLQKTSADSTVLDRKKAITAREILIPVIGPGEMTVSTYHTSQQPTIGTS